MKRNLTLTTLLLAGLLGCSQHDGPSSSVADTEQDINLRIPELGSAYNVFLDEFLTDTCLTKANLLPEDIEAIPPRQGEVTYSTNMDYQTISNKINGSADAKLDMNSLKVSGALAIANEHASDRLSTTFTIIANHDSGIYRIKDDAINSGRIKLNEKGHDLLLNGTTKEKVERCGTGYLKGFNLSTSLVATLRIVFRSDSDKDRFEGKLHLDMENFEANGELKTDFSELVKDSKMSITLKQTSGNTVRLSEALNGDVTACAAGNVESCLKAMDGLRVYAATTYPEQLYIRKEGENGAPDTYTISDEQLKTYWIYNPQIASYDNLPGASAWKERDLEETDIISLKESRKSMNDAFMRELQDKNRVRTILQNGMVTNTETRNKLMDLQEAFDSRMRIMADAIKPCYDILGKAAQCVWAIKGNPKAEPPIRSYKERLAEVPVDYSLMSIRPSGFMEYCTKMKSWHTTYYGTENSPGSPSAANIDLDWKTKDAINAILNIQPIVDFQDGRVFEPELNSLSEGKWSPAALASRSDGTKYWECSKLNTFLSKLDNEIVMVGKNLYDISPIVSFYGAEVLNLSDNKITNGIDALGKLQFLTTLTMENSKISDLIGIVGPRLSRLNLKGNDVTDESLKYLSGASSLETIDLSFNKKLKSLGELKNIPFLEVLDVRSTRISTESMRKFLSEQYPGLVGTPKVLWDGRQCTDLAGDTALENSQQLVCQ